MGRTYIKLYVSIFIKQNFSHPFKVFLIEIFYIELLRYLLIYFKETLESLLLDTTKIPHGCLLLLNFK